MEVTALLAVVSAVLVFVWSLTLWIRRRHRWLGLAALFAAFLIAFEVAAWQTVVAGWQSVIGLGLAVTALAAVALVARERAPPVRLFDGEFEARDAYLAHLFHSSPEAIALVDNKDRVLRVNVAFTELFGFGESEALGRPINDLIVPDHLKAEGESLTKEVAGGREIDVETLRQRRDGGLVDVQIIGRPVTGPEGQVAVYGIYRDITLQRRSALALRKLEKAVGTTQIGVTITDLDGKIIYVNPAEADMHGWDPGELLGRDVSVFVPGGQRRRMSRDEIKKMTSWRRETTNARRDGSTFPVRLTSDAVMDENGEPVAIVTTSEDITERRAAEERLRESEERYALAARGANDVLWDWNLTTNTLYLSPRWWSLLSLPDDHAIAQKPDEWLRRVHPEDLDDLQVKVAAHLQGASPHLEHEHRLKRHDGEWVWVLCRGIAVRDEEGNATRVAGSMTDITQRKRTEQQLHHDAFHDGLTGLPNRALFTTLLQRTIGRAIRSRQRRYAVLFLDLDRFKVVNDSLGHAHGDDLLISMARRLETCVRPGDTVARLGGDEFAVLLDDIVDAGDATRVADRIERELQEPFRLGDHEVFTSASIGIAFGGPHYAKPEEVIRDADLAMYRAKSQGKGRYEVFDRKMHEHAMTLLRLETDLRHALELGEFRVLYQPIVALKSNKITGLEALVRWEHPQRGLLGPPEFVPLAEETGLIVPLGKWVLREACRQIRIWQDRFPCDPPLTVSVNLSPRQFQQAEFAASVLTILEEAKLDPRSLKLEITEGLLMENPQANAAVIHDLTQAGVQVLIDDFGTGYSSLSYLHRFRVDALKIDRSFVTEMEGKNENIEIVKTIVTLARSLGMSVVAEGVETEGQQKYLSELECEEVQGYLFSQAVDAATIEQLLTNQGGEDTGRAAAC